MLKNIAVFCGSSLNTPEKYDRAAWEAGRVIASQGRRLIYGSGSGGVMGKVAMGAQSAGGYVIAVNVELYRDYPYTLDTDEYYVMETVPVRKLTMIERSDACIALPGGMGTLDELTEICCRNLMGLEDKPVGLLNTDGYFDGLLLQLRRAAADGFMTQASVDAIQVSDDMETLLRLLDAEAEKKAEKKKEG